MNDRRRGEPTRVTERRETAARRGAQSRRKRHLTLVVHGARAEFPGLRSMVDWVRGRGHTIRVRVTWEPGDGAVFAREAIAAGADTVIACGGDGTLNEVVNGLEGTSVALGIISAGTANDFARQTGIPDDPAAAMDIILKRKPVIIDTAAMNGRRFLNVSSGGIGAEATAETPPDAKASLGPVAYFISGLRKLAEFEPRRALFEAPGLRVEDEFVLFAVGNARATGGGTLVTPRASVRDGLLDVCIVGGMARKDFAKLVLRVKRGEHLESEGVRYLQVPWFRITSARPMTVNLDGESTQLRQAAYESRPSDLLVHLPRFPGHRRSVERDVANGG
ncbi:MAG TPA: YegS/Rv2252/BmrU family lipid kinase [Gemmatimonadaceae bacterium]|nr:YegS/Rv2252/BmrU family lipid kinase [Gemmatimonadaceae bacterium]